MTTRKRQVAILGIAEPGSAALRLAEEAGRLPARLGITVIGGGGALATPAAAQAAFEAGGLVVGVTTNDELNAEQPVCSVRIPSGMGDARNLIMALAGDACIVIGGRAGTIGRLETARRDLGMCPAEPRTGR